MHDGGGGVSGGHHGGGFGGHHHHGGGFAGHHHQQPDQGVQGAYFLPPTRNVQPPRANGPWGGPRSTATRYIALGAFVVVFLTIVFVVAH
ncbi:MAG TPA: hypothetical protein VGN81_00435 [Pseudonocardiaceae bacterium]|jgi:hypothetical protein